MIEGGAFGDSLELPAGSLVTWVNRDNEVHGVVADDGSLDSGDIEPDSSFAHRFETSGEFRLSCPIHPEMEMHVVVN